MSSQGYVLSHLLLFSPLIGYEDLWWLRIFLGRLRSTEDPLACFLIPPVVHLYIILSKHTIMRYFSIVYTTILCVFMLKHLVILFVSDI